MRKSRAFTFLEALVTLALVAVVFGALMFMLLEAFRIARKGSQKTVVAEAAELGLERMSSELREALILVNPLVGTPESQLIFHKVNPDNAATGRLPAVPPAPDPAATWNPFNAAYLLRVRYSVVGEKLVREVGPVGAPPTASMALADHIRGLSVDQVQNSHLRLVLSVQDGQVVSSHTMEVKCHAVP